MHRVATESRLNSDGNPKPDPSQEARNKRVRFEIEIGYLQIYFLTVSKGAAGGKEEDWRRARWWWSGIERVS